MKTIKITILLGFTIALISCRTTIPEHDTRRPTFNFHIQGMGLNEDMNQNFDFDNKVLYLKRGNKYKIILTGSDAGGIHSFLWEIPDVPAIEFTEPTYPEGWYGASVPGNKLQVAWPGDRVHPLTGAALSREILVNGFTSSTVEELQFFFAISDFHENEERKGLIIRIHNAAAGIGDR